LEIASLLPSSLSGLPYVRRDACEFLIVRFSGEAAAEPVGRARRRVTGGSDEDRARVP
jgi:hypothetical protein